MLLLSGYPRLCQYLSKDACHGPFTLAPGATSTAVVEVVAVTDCTYSDRAPRQG